MSLDACVRNTAAELGLDEKDVREIADRLAKHKKRLAAGDQVDRVDDFLKKQAAEEAEKARIAAALKRKHTALNIILRDEWERDLQALVADGVDLQEAVLAKLVGSYRGVTNARKSVNARRVALEGDWQAGLIADIKADPELAAVLPLLHRPKAAKPLMDDVVREMRELRPNGEPGRTGNRAAQKMAGVLAKYAEATRLELNRAGANIGKLDGWSPQSHDAVKLLRVSRDEWVEHILPRLDMDRSFAGKSLDEAREILRETYDTIVTGRDNMVSAKEKGQRTGPANLARSLEKHRVLHFRDADSWIEYADRFGRGNVFTAMMDHLHGAARKASLMQVLGPNPETFLDGLLESLQRRVKEDDSLPHTTRANLIGQLTRRDGALGTKIAKAYAEISGETFRPVSGRLTAARVGSNIRAVQSMAKLGGAVISSVTDLVTYAHGMRFQGKGILESYSDAFTGLLAGRPQAEQRELSLLLGVGWDSILGDIHARFVAEDNMPGWSSRLMSTFFRASGLTWWTDKLTNAFAAMSSAHMAQRAGQGWDALDPAFRHVLGLHGITAERWDVVRQMVHAADDGTGYIIPERAHDLPDEAFDGLIGQDWRSAKNPETRRAKLIERARRELELDTMAFFADEASFAVLRSDDRTRMVLTQGTKPGSTLGEAIRFIMQFKSFPIAYTQKILIPAIRGRGPGGSRDPAGISALIGMSMLFGYAAMTAKDALKNRTPKDPLKWNTLLAALVQGGGAGIYGDFLFAKANRFGNGPLETLAGPTLSTASDVLQLWQNAWRGEADMSDAFYLLLNNTPYLNLWYARVGLDLAILNDFQEWMSPGTFRNRERNMGKEFGQSYLVDPLRPSRALQ